MKGSRELEDRLQEWAEYYHKQIFEGIGYPSINILGVLQRDGGILERAKGPRLPENNLSAQQIEDWVCELTKSQIKYYLSCAKVLRQRYIYSSPNTTDKTLARKLNLSERNFYRYLQTAKNWLQWKLENEDAVLPPAMRHLYEIKKNVTMITKIAQNA